MYQHNTNIAGFILVNDEATNLAIAEAKSRIGDSEWKKGYTPDHCKIAQGFMKAHNAPYRFKLIGTLLGVSTKETKDASGNSYRKLRIELETEPGKTEILSLDVGTEFCERLLPKLGAAVRGHLGKQVSLACFPVQDERGGRQFWNHTASFKDADGNEIQSSLSHFPLATSKANAAAEALSAAGISDPKAIKAAKKSAKQQYFWDLANKIAAHCADQKASAAA
jgi:hypothetical protein